MSQKTAREQIDSLRRDLAKVRRDSLHATGLGNYMRVARLGTEVARLNKSILAAETGLIVRL